MVLGLTLSFLRASSPVGATSKSFILKQKQTSERTKQERCQRNFWAESFSSIPLSHLNRKCCGEHMGLRKKHQNMKTTALYGASESLVWLDRILHGPKNSPHDYRNNTCYEGNLNDFSPEGPGLFPRLNRVIPYSASLYRPDIHPKSEIKVKIVPAFIFDPLRS